MLAQSGIGAILSAAGYKPFGSYVIHTMTWRDLDFEREEEPDWERHWEVGNQLAQTGWCFRLNCVDAYREGAGDKGLYWGVRVLTVENAIWKLDLWTARPEEFAPMNPTRNKWASLLTEEKRAEIIAIKQALCKAPEYRKTLLSVHIYQAVLEDNIRGLDAFMTWWRKKNDNAGT